MSTLGTPPVERARDVPPSGVWRGSIGDHAWGSAGQRRPVAEDLNPPMAAPQPLSHRRETVRGRYLG